MGLTYTELIELLGDLTNTTSASSTSYTTAKKTRDINSAYAYFKYLADKASGKVQVDDTNQTDYPVLKFNLVSGQADYPITVDGASTPNQVTNILRVECANSSGRFSLLDPFDQVDEKESLNYLRSESGQPYRYDEMGGSLWLDPKPNYNYTNGLEVTVSRTPIYFLTSDTTKKAGIPDNFHEYLVYRPAYLWAVTHLPKVANGYLNILKDMEKEIGIHYTMRNSRQSRRLGTGSIRKFQ